MEIFLILFARFRVRGLISGVDDRIQHYQYKKFRLNLLEDYLNFLILVFLLIKQTPTLNKV
jgi:hypothetical protein